MFQAFDAWCYSWEGGRGAATIVTARRWLWHVSWQFKCKLHHFLTSLGCGFFTISCYWFLGNRFMGLGWFSGIRICPPPWVRISLPQLWPRMMTGFYKLLPYAAFLFLFRYVFSPIIQMLQNFFVLFRRSYFCIQFIFILAVDYSSHFIISIFGTKVGQRVVGGVESGLGPI